MDNIQLSKNFWLKEFDFVKPEFELLSLLQQIRDLAQTPVIITDSARTVDQHIAIYKKIYGDEWLNKIPWGSRHLPAYNRGLRAVDFKVKKGAKSFYTGKDIKEIVKPLSEKDDIFIGLGVGSQFVHLDVDRKKYTEWGYDY